MSTYPGPVIERKAVSPAGDSFGVEVWTSAAWREQATRWLDGRLAAAGITRTGAVTQPRVRPWATVLTAPSTAGPVWFKACGPHTAFEVGLYEILQAAVPARVLAPIATDVDRGWLILPDGGPPLGERLSGAALWEAMAAVLPQYGQLQRDLADRVDDLLAVGVVDMRPAALPRRFPVAVEAGRDYVERQGDAEDRARLRQVQALQATFEEWCSRLEALPGVASLDHNDLHPWNVLPGGAVKFYDWGDAVVAHPMASMLVPLEWMGSRAGAPEIARLRDAYLEAFSDLAPRATLVEALDLARRVGTVARSLVWHRAVSATPPEDLDPDFARAPLHALRPLLEEMP